MDGMGEGGQGQNAGGLTRASLDGILELREYNQRDTTFGHPEIWEEFLGSARLEITGVAQKSQAGRDR